MSQWLHSKNLLLDIPCLRLPLKRAVGGIVIKLTLVVEVHFVLRYLFINSDIVTFVIKADRRRARKRCFVICFF